LQPVENTTSAVIKAEIPIHEENNMKIRPMFVGLLVLAGLSSVALADISGGPVFEGGGRQEVVRCMLFNAGPGTATITSHEIATGGTPVSLAENSCGATLAAKHTCIISAVSVELGAHTCRFETNGGNLRGIIAVYGASDNMLHSSDMR
jgi:hypothetical protein